jgi:hypothetical protein
VPQSVTLAIFAGLLLASIGCPGEEPPPPLDDDDCADDDDSLRGLAPPLEETSLARAPVQIGLNSEGTALLGQSVTVCDLDCDGRDDLVVSLPEGNDGDGQIAVFLGSESEQWDDEMAVADASIVFLGGPGSRLGYAVACDDFDGDGRNDLAAVGARWFSPTGDEQFGLVIWHASDQSWAAVQQLSDAAVLTSDLGVSSEGHSGKAWMELASGDLDGDGAAELLLTDRWALPLGSPTTDTVYVIPGQRWDGSQALEDVTRARLSSSSPGSLQGGVLLIADLDGQPGMELVIGEPFAGSSNDHWGRASLVRDPWGDKAIAEIAYAQIEEPEEARAFGEAATTGDFDGDGEVDIALTAIEENIVGPEPHGSVWLFLGAGDLSGTVSLDTADGHVMGDPTGGYLGMDILRLPDSDGDGADDLLVLQPDFLDTPGTIWLLSGAAVQGDVTPQEVEVTRWRTDGRGSASARLAVGDFEGDGLVDFVVGMPEWEERTSYAQLNTGRVAVWLGAREALPEVAPTSWVSASLWIRVTASHAPMGAVTIESASGTQKVAGGEAWLELDRMSDWALELTSAGNPPHRLVGRSGSLDFLQEVMLLPSDLLASLHSSVGASVDPDMGHLIVALSKRDGSSTPGRGADIDGAYAIRGVREGTGLLLDQPISQGPADNSVVFFGNVVPGMVSVQFELEPGESCFPAPGGQDGDLAPAVEVVAGTVTIAPYRCRLNRF